MAESDNILTKVCEGDSEGGRRQRRPASIGQSAAVHRLPRRPARKPTRGGLFPVDGSRGTKTEPGRGPVVIAEPVTKAPVSAVSAGAGQPRRARLVGILAALSLMISSAWAATGQEDSALFTVDTRGLAAVIGGAGSGDSGVFTVDTRAYLGPLWAGPAGDSGVFTVDTRAGTSFSSLSGVVLESAQGRVRGPLAGATVELRGVASATTDARGQFHFYRLSPGVFTVTASKSGSYPVARALTLGLGEARTETLQLAATASSGGPKTVDFASPNGKHFIAGMPGPLTFEATVAWNGSPGTVYFHVAGTRLPAVLTDLGGGQARAELTVPAPAAITACSQLAVEVANGEGVVSKMSPGVYFSPMPGIVIAWSRENIPWTPSGLALYYSEEQSRSWEWPLRGGFSFKHSLGRTSTLKYDLLAGALSGSLGGVYKMSLGVDPLKWGVVGEGRLDLSGNLTIALAGCEAPVVTPGWGLAGKLKIGAEAPVALVVSVIIPPVAVVVDDVLMIPIIGKVVGALKVRVYFIVGGAVAGRYAGFQTGDCFLGTTSIDGMITMGVEAQSLVKAFGAEAGVYVGGTGTPEWQLCPDFSYTGVTVRGYAGVFASGWGHEYRREKGFDVRFDTGAAQGAGAAQALRQEAGNSGGSWQPIGKSTLQWGEANRLAASQGPRLKTRSLAGVSEGESETVVTNVLRLASPATVAEGRETLVLFAMYDPRKPWEAATDIGTAHEAGGGPWSLSRLADDQKADYSPRALLVKSNLLLATWEQVVGDVSNTTNPAQVAPHLEIAAAWQDRVSGAWSAPAPLTQNALVDRQPLPVLLGGGAGLLWIQNQGAEALGNAASGDRLLFSSWTGETWSEPSVLWSGPKGILSFGFATNRVGEGCVVLAVDEDGNPETREDRELYRLATQNGVWQPATRLTADSLEDALPVLVAPNGVPICVWSQKGGTSSTLLYSPLQPWNPKPVFSESSLANEAPTLDGVTLPGGAAVAYAVQGTNGVDIVAAFYDAALDRWSQPRQLTHDDAVESALALAWNGTELVIAYLKTHTLRTGTDVEIHGQMQHLENIPQPGRTDLCVLRHALGNDLAVAPDSLRVDPPNPAPGSAATLRATLENRGDLPAPGAAVVFYDGDPQNGGLLIGSAQTLSGPFMGGATAEVSVVWAVPADPTSHVLYVVADPALAIEDRDRSNNSATRQTVLPDLAIETCWSTEVGPAAVGLSARLSNLGVVPSGPVTVSWRLDRPDGEEIGRTNLASLAASQVFEVFCTWDTTGRHFTTPFSPVYVVVGTTNGAAERDAANNVSAQSVRVVPGYVPRLVAVTRTGGDIRLTFESEGASAFDFTIESTASLAAPIQWQAEPTALLTADGDTRFTAQLPPPASTRFYRVLSR